MFVSDLGRTGVVPESGRSTLGVLSGQPSTVPDIVGHESTSSLIPSPSESTGGGVSGQPSVS